MTHDKQRRPTLIRCFLAHRAVGWGLMILIYLAWLAFQHWGH